MTSPSRNILIVEDDELFARVMSKALKNRGFNSSFASSVEGAKGIMKDNNFDFAILDLNLGGESLSLIHI